jgi:hypothetical protein
VGQLHHVLSYDRDVRTCCDSKDIIEGIHRGDGMWWCGMRGSGEARLCSGIDYEVFHGGHGRF